MSMVQQTSSRQSKSSMQRTLTSHYPYSHLQCFVRRQTPAAARKPWCSTPFDNSSGDCSTPPAHKPNPELSGKSAYRCECPYNKLDWKTTVESPPWGLQVSICCMKLLLGNCCHSLERAVKVTLTLQMNTLPLCFMAFSMLESTRGLAVCMDLNTLVLNTEIICAISTS